MKVNIKSKLIAGIVASTFISLSALADPIIVEIEGGEIPDSLGGFSLTPFDEPTAADCATSTDSPLGGEVEFQNQSNDPMCMEVKDPNWWEWDHGNVFTTGENWIELVLPANTNAFVFWVGGNTGGTGWIEAYDDNDGFSGRVNFGGNTDIDFGRGDSPGFGVYSSSCSAISRIIIEPFDWGTGNFATSQGECASVPEPAPITLLGLGLLGLAVSRRMQRKAAKVSEQV